MQDYINRIKKLGADDYVNGETFNSIIQQLQSNIDLLYRSQASSTQNWNISELVFGNMMDYDQTGQKRFTNGGKLDSLEKILPFSESVGSIAYEETSLLNNSDWLTWTIPSGISNNISLTRNIAVPEALRHQNVLIGVKLSGFVGNDVKANERFEIYVNGVYSGTGETGTTVINGITEAKTIYGVYSLTGTESNLQVELVRSTTNGNTPSNYVVRVSNMYVGLHTLGNSSFEMNFPISGSAFVGAGADINAFYDFPNNAVRPIPSFLINSSKLFGDGSLTVNITTQGSSVQDEYWIGLSGTGDQTGIDDMNIMLADDFFVTSYFAPNPITVHLTDALSDQYPAMVFDKGNYQVYLDSTINYIDIASIKATNGANVDFFIDPYASGTTVNIDNIIVNEKSRLGIDIDPSASINDLNLITDGVNVTEGSYLDVNTGTFSMDILTSNDFEVTKGSNAEVNILSSNLDNGDGLEGFGFAVGNVYAVDKSQVKFTSEDDSIYAHIGIGSKSDPVYAERHSNITINGFGNLSTSADSKTFKARKHSSIEVDSTIQYALSGSLSGSPTGFSDIDLAHICTFGSNLCPGILNETLIYSHVYQL